MSVVGLDTSEAIPLIVGTHEAHAEVVRWWDRRQVAQCGHAMVETYSVLTRLPGDVRVRPTDAALLIGERFGPCLALSEAATLALPGTLAGLGIANGAVYDALTGLDAVEDGVVLATRDLRARSTYEAVGAEVLVAG